MAVNPAISMSTQPVDTATGVYKAQDQQNQNAMATEQVLKAHYDNMDSREKSRLASTVIGASHLKSFLDNNDVEGAQNFLTQRQKALQVRMAHGENIDTQETDYALDALKNGKVDQLKNDVNGIMAAGQVYGILNPAHTAGGDTGVLVNRLIQEGSAKNVNDALQQIKGGAGQKGRNDADIQTGRQANYETQTGKNTSDSQYAAKIAFNKETGAGAGQQVIKNDNTMGSLDNLEYSISQANQLLPKVAATGPILGRVGAAAEDPDYANLQGTINSITLQAKDLYNLGSGQGFTDADRDFLREVVAGKYARAETIQAGLQRFNEALQHRRQFLAGQNQQYQQQYGAGAGVQQTAQPQAPGKVRVSNGKETYMIDPNDLPHAQAEGFQQQ